VKRYGNPKRTKLAQKTAAVQMLTMRQSLDGLTVETLTRSYGLSEPDATTLLRAEQQRRAHAA